MKRAILLALFTTLLAGCAGEPAERLSSPSPITSASVSSGLDDAARQTWQEYFPLSTRLLRDPDVPVSTIRSYLSKAEYKDELSSVKEFRTAGLRLVGSTSTRNFTVQQKDRTNEGLVVFVCIDNRESRIVDEAGKAVGQSSRPKTITLQVAFESAAGEAKIVKSEAWSGSSIC